MLVQFSVHRIVPDEPAHQDNQPPRIPALLPLRLIHARAEHIVDLDASLERARVPVVGILGRPFWWLFIWSTASAGSINHRLFLFFLPCEFFGVPDHGLLVVDHDVVEELKKGDQFLFLVGSLEFSGASPEAPDHVLDEPEDERQFAYVLVAVRAVSWDASLSALAVGLKHSDATFNEWLRDFEVAERIGEQLGQLFLRIGVAAFPVQVA